MEGTRVRSGPLRGAALRGGRRRSGALAARGSPLQGARCAREACWLRSQSTARTAPAAAWQRGTRPLTRSPRRTAVDPLRRQSATLPPRFCTNDTPRCMRRAAFLSPLLMRSDRTCLAALYSDSLHHRRERGDVKRRVNQRDKKTREASTHAGRALYGRRGATTDLPHAGAEERRADAHHRRAFLDGDAVRIAHAHGKDLHLRVP